MHIATSMSLKDAMARWLYNGLSNKLEPLALNISALTQPQRERLLPQLFFSEGKGGRFWADGDFSFEDLEALYVLGRHFTKTQHCFTSVSWMKDAFEELQGKPNGYFSPRVNCVPNFVTANQNKISVVGETGLDEVEAVLLLCRKQLKGIEK